MIGDGERRDRSGIPNFRVVTSRTERLVRGSCGDCDWRSPGSGSYTSLSSMVKRAARRHAGEEGHRVEVDEPTATVYDATDRVRDYRR